MRTIVILGLMLALGSCAGDRQDRGANFRDPKTGEVVHACGPYPGIPSAVEDAEKGCADAYDKAGWTRVTP